MQNKVSPAANKKAGCSFADAICFVLAEVFGCMKFRKLFLSHPCIAYIPPGVGESTSLYALRENPGKKREE